MNPATRPSIFSTALPSNNVMPLTGTLFSDAVYLFALDKFSSFSVLQSRIHESWARLLASSMKTDLRYAASDCFETFPFPQSNPRAVFPALEAVGQELYDARARFMVETDQGLTKTYNALKDPACEDPRVLELRRLHEMMDRAVLDAYGWSDIAVPPYCPKSDDDRAALQTFEDEVIDRLYVLNAERARDEAQLGPVPKKSARAEAEVADSTENAKPAKRPRGAKTPKNSTKDQGKLFGT